jgi:hypothetical protein
MERVDPTTEWGKILGWCSQQKVTDLHIQVDRRYSIHYANNWRRVEMDMHGFAPAADSLLKPDPAR